MEVIGGFVDLQAVTQPVQGRGVQRRRRQHVGVEIEQ